jgi:hypothetical protein
MLHTITIIRLDDNTMKFENTELHSFILLGDLEKKLISNDADFSQFERCVNMEKGASITLESLKNNKRRFFYIHRIS